MRDIEEPNAAIRRGSMSGRRAQPVERGVDGGLGVVAEPVRMTWAFAVARVVEREHAVAVAREHADVGGDPPATAAGAVAEEHGRPVAGRMFFSGNAIFSSFGIGTIIVVGVAMVGSLTFLPAVLSYLGQKGWLEKGRVPYIAKGRHRNGGESRIWNAILTRVLKRPLVSTVLAGGLLVALTIPALGMQFKEPGTEGMSRSRPIMQTLDRIDAAFPGGSVPANVVVNAHDVTTPQPQAAIEQLHDQTIATGQPSEPSGVDISPDKTVAVVSLAVKGKAPTPCPTARWRSSATRLSRTPWASARAPRSRSPA